MEIKRIQCAGCGAPLEVWPWSSRIQCPSCGAVYYVEKDQPAANGAAARPQRNRALNEAPDNPAAVVLVPREKGRIDLGLRYAPAWWYDRDLSHISSGEIRSCSSDAVEFEYNKPYYTSTPRNDLMKKFGDDLVMPMRFFSLLSRLTGERFGIDVGTMYLDIRPVYDRQVYSAPVYEMDYVFDAGRLTEPDSYFLSGRDSLRRRGDDAKGVDRAARDRFYSAQIERASALLKRYGIDHREEIRYSAPSSELFDTVLLFGRKIKDKYRVWHMRFRDWRLFKDVRPEDADTVFTPEELQKALRIGDNECVEAIAQTIYKEMAAEEEAELSAREKDGIKYQTSIRTDGKGVIYSRNIFRNGTLSNCYSKKVSFNEYGMKDIDDPLISAALLAHILARCKGYEKQSGSVGWDVVDLKNGSVYIGLSSMTKGIYRDWI